MTNPKLPKIAVGIHFPAIRRLWPSMAAEIEAEEKRNHDRCKEQMLADACGWTVEELRQKQREDALSSLLSRTTGKPR
jgi:hypothetical protein